MNEQIKLFAEQAGLGRERWNTTEQFHAFLEKFAELIVRECLSLARSYPSQNDDYAAGIDSVRDSIKQHFGV